MQRLSKSFLLQKCLDLAEIFLLKVLSEGYFAGGFLVDEATHDLDQSHS